MRIELTVNGERLEADVWAGESGRDSNRAQPASNPTRRMAERRFRGSLHAGCFARIARIGTLNRDCR